MPERVEECVRSVMDDNPDMDEDRAWAICKAEENKGNLEDGADLATGCPDGQVNIGGECVPIEKVDAPASLLSQPRIMASASPLDTQPIEREELSGNRVAYRNIKLIDAGVWTDSASETPTLYDDRTFENTEPEFDADKHDGPPVNIAHDLHKQGVNKGEPHEASIGGYIDPDSLQTDGEALYGDIILDRDTDAGAFADTNLKSALQNGGTAGFSPSVELMPEELREADHAHAEEYVAAAELTGTGLVRDPASKSVDLARETQNRAVALAASGKEVKTLRRESGVMSPEKRDEIRAEVMQRSLQMDEIQDDAQAIADELDVPVDEVMEVLDPLLDDDEDEGEGPPEGEEGEELEDGDPDEDPEEDEKEEMADAESIEAIQEQMASLASRLEEVEDAVAQSMSEGEVKEELEDAKAELAAAEEVEDVDKRLSKLEEEPEDARTLADGQDEDEFDWADADGGVSYDSATGSMSK